MARVSFTPPALAIQEFPWTMLASPKRIGICMSLFLHVFSLKHGTTFTISLPLNSLEKKSSENWRIREDIP
jgi:hypothetical protein